MNEGVGPLLGRLVLRLMKRRALWLVLVAALTLVLLLVGRRLVLEEDLQAFLPTDNPAIAEHARALRAFRFLDLVRVDIGPVPSSAEGENDRARLLAGTREFEASVRSPLIAKAVTEIRPETGLAVADLASRSLPSLVEPESVAPVVSRFEDPAELDARLASHFKTLLDIDGTVYAQNVIARDPFGLEGPFFERLKDLQAVATGTRLDAGRIMSADGRHVLFLLEPEAPASNTDAGAKLKILIAEATRRANAAADAVGPGAPLRTLAVGGHFAHIENSSSIQRDAWLTSIVSLVAMLVVYALIFPRRWLIPLTVLPLAFGGIFGMAVCAIFMHKISAIAVGFGGILIGLADDFVVHLYYFYEVRSRDGHPEPAVAAVERIAAPTLAAGAAIAASFAALAASGFPGQRDLAIFAATSLAGTLAFCLLIHPLILPRSRSKRPLPDAGRPLRALLAWVERHEKPVIAAVVVTTLALGYAAIRIRFEDDPRALDARSAATHADEDELGGRWGDPGDLALVVASGPDLDAALGQNERVLAKLDELKARGEILGASSIAPLAPSRVTQERRRAAWSALWTDERRTRVIESLRRLGPRHHFNANAFAAFFERIGGTGEPVDVPALARGPLAELVGRRIATDEKGTLVLTFVRVHRTNGVSDLGWTDTLEHETGAVVTTGLTFARALIALVQRRLAVCGALSFLVVLAILIPALRRPRYVLAAALPLAVGLVWSIGIFALAGTSINAVNFLIPVLTFGLSVDYVLFLASGYLRPPEVDAKEEVAQAQGAVVASGSTTLFGMASLLLAHHPALWSVGVVALVGTAASLVAIFLITPTLLRRRG